jgi:hypothetical protein
MHPVRTRPIPLRQDRATDRTAFRLRDARLASDSHVLSCETLLQKLKKLVLSEHLDVQLLDVGQLGSGVFTRNEIVSLLADGATQAIDLAGSKHRERLMNVILTQVFQEIGSETKLRSVVALASIKASFTVRSDLTLNTVPQGFTEG